MSNRPLRRGWSGKKQHPSGVSVDIGRGLGAAIDMIGPPNTSQLGCPQNQLRDNRGSRQCIVSLARPKFFLDLKRHSASSTTRFGA
jgi:hypothetical protein